MKRPNLYNMTATEARLHIEADIFSLEDYVRSLLARYYARDGDVKAWAHIEPERVLQQARRLDQLPRECRGPLHGFVFGVKDAILTEGPNLLDWKPC